VEAARDAIRFPDMDGASVGLNDILQAVTIDVGQVIGGAVEAIGPYRVWREPSAVALRQRDVGASVEDLERSGKISRQTVVQAWDE
jgi:hypothetical protein